ncbi:MULTISPECIES: XrtA/PEP-CTERM system amidotransferase [Rhodanobacter]|uniref:XrtA/PEP-CTERM system amidotransferase n=1 Tax=Rhodanobacter TaxID=75309 RepID=UPI0003F6954F|nr:MULTISPECIES: XrtA/PEP-CTERM system amidotransferase [Rhodanobacter]KZC18567.1 asparagine synthetase B [Rhodanobacter denitrificans]UJJ50245.1 amidotransferase 1, exosortase A system-associated [Rhodanobacter denitrificans]UJM92960.1 amidotransferase 1, exosortase A system-associated [Rhodanobacter denitrificans]UJM96490.1 amidotransferase 1, exosortase A system-associated [Rhodanobacter denitrificans]UJN20680.1 amidotransferase 1, exosortase A system-associated [Rhodanobacter denitrificans
MCGLAGIVSSRHVDVDERALLAMRDAQLHRGPDEAGLYLGKGVGLGHRRLSIIDLGHGQQPMVDETAGLALIYNGELYNFPSLKAELEARGVVFRSRCDTEVLLRAWQQWGEACLTRLVGMFAFAVWDMRTQRIYLARDQLGIKPLYYGFTRTFELVFASELKGLLAHPGVERRLDPQALEDYLALGYVPDPRSIYRGIFKLPPGHWLSWHAGEPEPVPRQYWDVPFKVAADMTADEAAAQLHGLLDRAVAGQMIADVPLGAFLSGGVDSSAVVASMSRASQQPVRTCSIGFDHGGFDESAYARRVAEHLHTQHFEQRVSADDYDLLDTLAAVYDEPFSDSSALPTYRVCGLARTQVTVALSGDGGDENFAGYRRYRLHAWESGMRARLPLALRKPLFGVLGSLYPKADWAPRPLRAKTTLQALGRDDVEAYFHTVSTTSAALRQQLYSAGFKRELQGYNALAVFRAHARRAPTDHPLLLAQYLDFKTWLPGDILTKVDRASMAHSLEVRVPLLDHRLVEWASSLPPGLKLRGGTAKYILKKTLEPDLPNDVLYRSKMGFRVPVAAWLRGPLARRARDALLAGAVAECGYFEPAVLDRLLQQHAAGRRDHSATLWSLLMLDAFLRRMQQPAAAAPAGPTRRVATAGAQP